jgi:hypothetical protein
VDDLIARLTAAIDETERNGFLGQSPLGYVTADKVYLPTEVQIAYGSEDVTARQAVLRGCAADRKILAIHKPLEVWNGGAEPKYWPKHAAGQTVWICERCDTHDSEYGWREDEPFPCGTVRAVAERYGLEDTGG